MWEMKIRGPIKALEQDGWYLIKPRVRRSDRITLELDDSA